MYDIVDSKSTELMNSLVFTFLLSSLPYSLYDVTIGEFIVYTVTSQNNEVILGRYFK